MPVGEGDHSALAVPAGWGVLPEGRGGSHIDRKVSVVDAAERRVWIGMFIDKNVCLGGSGVDDIGDSNILRKSATDSTQPG